MLDKNNLSLNYKAALENCIQIKYQYHFSHKRSSQVISSSYTNLQKRYNGKLIYSRRAQKMRSQLVSPEQRFCTPLEI